MPRMDMSSTFVIEDFGEAVLGPLPRGAVLLTKGDMVTNSVRFAQAILGRRGDISHIDLELLRGDWYAPLLRPLLPRVNFPGTSYSPRPGGFNAQAFLRANPKRRVFVAYEFVPGDTSWRTTHRTRPLGVADEVVALEEEGWTLKEARRCDKAVLFAHWWCQKP
eukprot:Hpha_TRINITY_DN4227_c0_g1::TRINITY_DN4227_c0_g1_i1::g.186655::m.186655